jgi:hypothetical protein
LEVFAVRSIQNWKRFGPNLIFGATRPTAPSLRNGVFSICRLVFNPLSSKSKSTDVQIFVFLHFYVFCIFTFSGYFFSFLFCFSLDKKIFVATATKNTPPASVVGATTKANAKSGTTVYCVEPVPAK